MNSLHIKNVLVTGASGKLGQAVVPELLRAGYCVRAMTYYEDRYEQAGVEIIEGDLADITLAPKLLEDMDAVIHLAHVKENRETFMDVCVRGTFRLLDEAKGRSHIKQFIQAGSDAQAGIYYYPQPTPITEGHPHRGYPGYYPLSKVLEEVLCEQYTIMWQKPPITILRFSWVHTEDDILAHATIREPNLGVPIWRDLAVKAEQKRYFEDDIDAACMMVHPDGRPCVRQIVSLPDCVQAVMLALNNPGAIGEAFNVSGPGPFSYKVLAEYIAEKLDLPIVEFVEPEFHDFSIDLNKSRQVLGYKPEGDIYRIVDDAIAFRKAGKNRTTLKYIG